MFVRSDTTSKDTNTSCCSFCEDMKLTKSYYCYILKQIILTMKIDSYCSLETGFINSGFSSNSFTANKELLVLTSSVPLYRVLVHFSKSLSSLYTVTLPAVISLLWQNITAFLKHFCSQWHSPNCCSC